MVHLQTTHFAEANKHTLTYVYVFFHSYKKYTDLQQRIPL